MHPSLSVIMPVYNCEQYLAEAIDSVLAQTFTDFELLLIDDASTDRTIPIINSYKDSRIRLIQKQAQTGITDSLNIGLKLAKGEFIARMDGDDISLPERFEKQINYLRSHPGINMIGSLYRVMGYNHTVKRPITYEQIKVHLLEDNYICHPTIVIRKSALEKIGLNYDPDYLYAEDYKFFADMIDHGVVENLEETLLVYRWHASQTSHVKSEQQRVTADRIRLLMLRKLMDTECLTQEQTNLHLRFIKNKVDAMINFPEESRWIKKIIEENRQRNFFNESLLTTFLKKKHAENIRLYFTAAKQQYRLKNVWYLFLNMHQFNGLLSRKELAKFILKYFIPSTIRVNLKRQLLPSL